MGQQSCHALGRAQYKLHFAIKRLSTSAASNKHLVQDFLPQQDDAVCNILSRHSRRGSLAV